MNKLMAHAAAIIMIVYSVVSFSADPPETPGTLYDNGPLSPLVADTDLSDAEKAAYALFEGVMQIAEAKIHASSCSSSASTSDVAIFTDGSVNNRYFNFIDVVSSASSISLNADLRPPVEFRGQKILIDQDGAGSLVGTAVSNFTGTVKYNSPKNIMWGVSRMDVLGINGFNDRYQSKVIKDFYRGSTDSVNVAYNTIIDWGLQSLHKLGFPVNKYWQRSKSQRSNAVIGRTVFVKDRLAGFGSCRITIKTSGFNNEDFFSQEGVMTIEAVSPSTPVPAFDEFAF